MLGDAPSLLTLSCCPSELERGVFGGGGVESPLDDGGVEGTGRWGRRTGRLSWFTLFLLLFSGLKFNKPLRQKIYFFLIFHTNVSSTVW